MKNIPQYEPVLDPSDYLAVMDQMRSGFVGSGKKVEEFEQAVSEVSGDKFVAATTSGTIALLMAISSLELKQGSTILFPSYTNLAGAHAALFLGYKVKIVDIKYETLCMNPISAGLAINKAKEEREFIGAILFVNHNGYCGEDLKTIREICNRNSIPMIEDCAQGFAIRNNGITGDVGVFSFSVPKIITTGQGGAVITSNYDLYEKVKRIRDHGDNWRKTRIHEYLGLNFKFNDLLASYGLSQIKRLHKICEKRKEIWDEYDKHISVFRYGMPFTWMVLHPSEKTEEIILELRNNNIFAEQYYKPAHYSRLFKNGAEESGVADYVYKKIVYLPSSLNLTKNDIIRICHIINSIER